jgi:hypothetical protein
MYGSEGASMANVQRAAKMANAHDFIMRIPDSYKAQAGLPPPFPHSSHPQVPHPPTAHSSPRPRRPQPGRPRTDSPPRTRRFCVNHACGGGRCPGAG